MSKVALVTGANRGIGLAISRQLSSEGLKLILAVRDLKYKEELLSEFPQAKIVKIDLNNPHSIEEEISEFASEVDVLINNAGVLFSADKLLESSSTFYESMQVMLESPYELIKKIAPYMIEKKFGRIVNVSSGWGSFGESLGGPHAYGVAKASLNALTVALNRELPDNVKINAMCPGWVKTRRGGEAAPRTPEFGAKMAIHLATLDENGPSGKFLRMSDEQEIVEVPW